MQVSKLLVVALGGLVLGCSGVTPDPLGDMPGPGPDMQPTPQPVPEPDPCFKIDFLFVVDDSYSMYEEQSNLIQNFPKFLDVIDNYVNSAGAFLDYRLAVTTTGVATTTNPSPYATNGAFRNACGIDRPWVERQDYEVGDAFTCRATVGVDGPGIEMPLLAIERALTDRIQDGTNGEFLRDDALLAIIILTDEDDCANYDGSVADPECHADLGDTVDFLDALTGDRTRWAVSVIAGDTDCSSGFGSAEEASRLKQLIAKTGDNGVFSSICQGDLSPALTDALDTFSAACEQFGGVE